MLRMNNLNLIKLLAAVSLITAGSAFAGTRDGGGGGAYVCRNSDGSARTSRMADIWESQNTPWAWPHRRGKLSIRTGDAESAEAQFAKALAKIAATDPQLARRVSDTRDALFTGRNSLPADISISLPEDLRLGYFPTGCPPEGIMYYNAFSEQLDVREDLFATLATQTDVAAAWMHEAIYKIMRDDEGADTSKDARRLVACLFSDEPGCLVVPASRGPAATDWAFDCTGPKTKLKVWYKAPSSNEYIVNIYTQIAIEKTSHLVLGYRPVFYLGFENRKPGSEGISSQATGSPTRFYSTKSQGSNEGMADMSPRVNVRGTTLEADGSLRRLHLDSFQYGHTYPYESVNHPVQVIPANEDLTCRRVQ